MKITLFPFLSVLLCMMGAMIMLLVVAAQNVREGTGSTETINSLQTLTLQEAEELNEQIDIKVEDADWFAQKLASAKEHALEELAESQLRLALAEKETQKIRDELARLEQLAQQLDDPTVTSPEEVAHLKRLLAQQQQRKEAAELELAELQKEAAKKEKSYAIAPYRGPNGTFRRPIYIECCNDKIVIQPEGIELYPGDFQTLDDLVGNPFDSVLRTIRQYYVETNQIVRGSEPYPLFVVRPSGVEMYENARRTMYGNAQRVTGSWVKDFGYEIVNEDWHIHYHQPDEELRLRIARQLELARSRSSGFRVAMQMAEHAAGYGNNAQQYSVDHRGNVRPLGGPMQGGEDLQQRLAANRQRTEQFISEQQAGRQQAAGQHVAGQRDFGQEFSTEEVTSVEQQRTENRDSRASHANRMSSPAERVGEDTMEQQRRMPSPQSSPQRMQNWGLKGATRFSAGISRTVRIRCEADRFVLPAQAGLQAERRIPITDSVSKAADQLVQAIWEFQESWGSAGEQEYWRPILRVQVLPGGEQRLSELKIHLKNSGLVIEE